MVKRPFSIWDLGSAFALTGLVSTGMWAAFETTGAVAVAAGLSHFTLAYLLLRGAGWPNLKWPTGAGSISLLTTGLSIVLLLPLFYILVQSWNFDFPLSGDHDHHLLSALSAVDFWSQSWGYLVGFTLLVLCGSLWRWPTLWPGLIFSAMVIASHWTIPLPSYFLRYPATTYLLDVPMVQLAHALNFNSIWGLCRLVNFTALVAWLLILRTYFFGQKKTGGWWIIAAFVLLQRDFLITFDSVNLESWSVVWLLLALEALFEEDLPPWWAVFFAGVACIFKDSAAIPFLVVGLAAVVRARRNFKEIFTVLAAGSLSILPFTIYYLTRRHADVWRTVGLAPLDTALTAERFEQLWFRLDYQFHVFGLCGLALLIVAMIFGLWRAKELRLPGLVLFIGGWAEFALFFVDRISQPYVGFPRLLMVPWLLILSPAFLFKGRAAQALVLLVVLSQAPALWDYALSLQQPAYAQNFSEDFNVPYHYPIRTLMERAKNDLKPHQVVAWVVSNPATKPIVFSETYRDLVGMYEWRALTARTLEGKCHCLPGLALLIMTTHPRNIRTLSPLRISTEPTIQISDACLAEIERTCRCWTEGDPIEGRLCVPR